MDKIAEPELTRPLRIDKIPAAGIEESIIASAREREHLTTRFDLVSIEKLEAKLSLTPKQTGAVFEITGTLTADVMQRCVVTLEPLPARVDQPIKAHFAPPGWIGDTESERALEDEDWEPITNGIIDLGELVAQHLGLALDPYPRKPGLPPIETEYGEKAAPKSPFAGLVHLKDRDPE